MGASEVVALCQVRAQPMVAASRLSVGPPAWLLHTDKVNALNSHLIFYLVWPHSIFTILGCFRSVGVGCVCERALLINWPKLYGWGPFWPDLTHSAMLDHKCFWCNLQFRLVGWSRCFCLLLVGWKNQQCFARTNKHFCEQEYVQFTEMIAPRLYRHLPNDT